MHRIMVRKQYSLFKKKKRRKRNRKKIIQLALFYYQSKMQDGDLWMPTNKAFVCLTTAITGETA